MLEQPGIKYCCYLLCNLFSAPEVYTMYVYYNKVCGQKGMSTVQYCICLVDYDQNDKTPNFSRNTIPFTAWQGVMRAGEEREVIQSGLIWDNLPLVEKELDAIDFTRLRHAVKINKFPGSRDLNR